MNRVCPCCGHSAPWDAFEPIGLQEIGSGDTIELRNCACGTTLAEQVRPVPEWLAVELGEFAAERVA